jgi:rhodanese-related sulfurtransferase/thioredoxin-related protein
MTRFFNKLCLGLFLAAVSWTAPAAELTWLTDLQQAKIQAKAEKKSVLLVFHGSDWCPPCVLMQRQVFSAPEFIEYARQTLVLVDVDFPENRAQSEALKQANLALKEKFNVGKERNEGFPTIVLLNDEGQTVYQEMGFDSGGLPGVLANLKLHAIPASLVAEPTRFKNLSVDEFASMTADPQNIILDVRTPDEFKAGHLPRAINLNVNAADFAEKAAQLDKNKTYLVHCASGGRSVKACEKLAQLNVPKLYNLPGGFRAWQKAGQPIEK